MTTALTEGQNELLTSVRKKHTTEGTPPYYAFIYFSKQVL